MIWDYIVAIWILSWPTACIYAVLKQWKSNNTLDNSKMTMIAMFFLLVCLSLVYNNRNYEKTVVGEERVMTYQINKFTGNQTLISWITREEWEERYGGQ